MLKINNQEMITYQIDTLKKIKGIEKIILSTSKNITEISQKLIKGFVYLSSRADEHALSQMVAPIATVPGT